VCIGFCLKSFGAFSVHSTICYWLDSSPTPIFLAYPQNEDHPTTSSAYKEWTGQTFVWEYQSNFYTLRPSWMKRSKHRDLLCKVADKKTLPWHCKHNTFSIAHQLYPMLFGHNSTFMYINCKGYTTVNYDYSYLGVTFKIQEGKMFSILRKLILFFYLNLLFFRIYCFILIWRERLFRCRPSLQ
jgi:hypothetical protein